MTGEITQPNWAEQMLDERQQKEVALARLYTSTFNHGTTGHAQLVLIARLAELLDTATAGQALEPPKPADMVLSFGIHSGKTLGWLAENKLSYLEWLAREARDEKVKAAAIEVYNARFEPKTEEEPPF